MTHSMCSFIKVYVAASDKTCNFFWSIIRENSLLDIPETKLNIH